MSTMGVPNQRELTEHMSKMGVKRQQANPQQAHAQHPQILGGHVSKVSAATATPTQTWTSAAGAVYNGSVNQASAATAAQAPQPQVVKTVLRRPVIWGPTTPLTTVPKTWRKKL